MSFVYVCDNSELLVVSFRVLLQIAEIGVLECDSESAFSITYGNPIVYGIDLLRK